MKPINCPYTQAAHPWGPSPPHCQSLIQRAGGRNPVQGRPAEHLHSSSTRGTGRDTSRSGRAAPAGTSGCQLTSLHTSGPKRHRELSNGKQRCWQLEPGLGRNQPARWLSRKASRAVALPKAARPPSEEPRALQETEVRDLKSGPRLCSLGCLQRTGQPTRAPTVCQACRREG